MMSEKGFFAKWKEGITKLTPLQLMESKLWGFVGTVIGGIGATSTFFWVFFKYGGLSNLFIAVVVGFVTHIQLMEAYSTYKQIKTIKDMFIVDDNKSSLIEGEQNV